MSKASNMNHAIKLAAIVALTVGTMALATEDPDSVVEDDIDRMEILEEFASDEEGPVNSAQARTLDLMLMIWILKNPSSDNER